MQKLQKQAFDTATLRKQDVSVAGTLKHLSGEVAELSEACFTGTIEDKKSEVADVVICCLTLSEVLGIDLMESVENKMEYNRKRIGGIYA